MTKYRVFLTNIDECIDIEADYVKNDGILVFYRRGNERYLDKVIAQFNFNNIIGYVIL